MLPPDVQGCPVGLLKQCVFEKEWHCDVKAVPIMTQIQRGCLLFINSLVAN